MKTSPVNMEARKNLDMRTGDTVRVNQKIQDKSGKTRLQAFEGMILSRKHGSEAGATFTVRRVSNGFGVEKIFPLYSPMIESIEVIKRSKVRRSKLYHVRETALKQISKRMKMMFVDIKEEKAEPEAESPAEEETDKKEENTETTNEEKADETPKEEVKEETPTEEEKAEEAPKEEKSEEETEEKTEESEK
jgi:large subunit ribosomal protein L19